MTRRIAIIAGAVLAVLVLILAGAWVFRAPLAGWAARSILAQRGLEADFEVARLDLDGALLRDVRVGEDAARIPRLELSYRLGELLDGHLRAVRLTRPQLQIVVDENGDITAAGFPVGGGAGGGAPVDVGLISVTNGAAELVTPGGTLPMQVDLEGGPQAGWRGWLMLDEGAAGWRDWSAQVRSGEAEFEMIGDDLLARAALRLDGAGAPGGAAEGAELAATARLAGLEQGYGNARGQAAVNLAVRGARADDPQAAARILTAAQAWEDAPGAGPLAAPLVERLALSLSGFDAEAAAMLDVTPEAVTAALDGPAAVEAEAGPDIRLTPPQDGPAFRWSREGAGWRLQAGVEAEGGPELDLEALTIAFSDGLAAAALEGDLAPFGDGETELGAEDLRAAWERTPAGWRADVAGALSFSGAAFTMDAQDARLDADLEIVSEAGAVRVQPAAPDGTLRLDAAGFDVAFAQMQDVRAELAPAMEFGAAGWRVAPGAPSISAAVLETESMRLEGLALSAPDGGVTLEGEGGAFSLMDGDGPVALTLDRVRGGSWTARDVTSARINGAAGPLLQRTEAGETFLNALAGTARAGAFELDSGTVFGDVRARDVRLSGAVAPEMELDAVTPGLQATVDTLGRTGLALQTGRASAILSTAPGAPMTARFSLADAELAGEALPVALDRGQLTGMAVFTDPMQAEIDIENATFRAAAEPAPVTPATLSGRLTAEDGIVAMDLSGALEEAPAGSLTVTLRHDLEAGTGQADVDIPRIEFRSGGPQPQDVIRPLRGLVADVTGAAEAHFQSRWYGNAARSSGSVTLDGMDLATRFGPVEEVSTQFEMSSLAPLLTPAPQEITIGRFNPGVPLEEGQISVELLEGGRIGIQEAGWPFAGGEISLAPLVWDPAAESHEAALVAERLNLGFLAGMFNNDALNAGGTVSGRVPLVIEGGNIRIDQARLTADEDGFVSYAGQASDAAAQANEQANLAFRALENLQYRVLEATLDGPVAGQMDLGLTIEGYNPDVLDGYPFKFNINLSAELMRLIRETTQGFRIRQQIEESLQESGVAPEGVSVETGPAPAPMDTPPPGLE